MRLDDSTIAHIAKIVQIAILTGTDIVDNLRQVEFSAEDDTLFMDPDYKETFDANVQKMLNEAQ